MVRGLAAVAGVAAVLVLVGGVAAHAETFLANSDATLLAGRLAEATKAQNICYGWELRVDGGFGRLQPGTDVGSNHGVGRDVGDGDCADYVKLVGFVSFTPESSESPDTAGWEIRSSLARPPTDGDLAAIGLTANDMLDDDGDEVLFDAVLALPRLVADAGQAPALPLATPSEDASPAGAPTGRPGPEIFRQHGASLALGAVLVFGGVLLALWVRYGERVQRRVLPKAGSPRRSALRREIGTPGRIGGPGPASGPGPAGSPDPAGGWDPAGGPERAGSPDPAGGWDPAGGPERAGTMNGAGSPDRAGSRQPDRPPTEEPPESAES
jgi:hypothetical protein